MVEGVPIIVATKQRLFQWHVEILFGTQDIASVPFPGLIADHGLTTENGHVLEQCEVIRSLSYP
jgi:hypothetical protein